VRHDKELAKLNSEANKSIRDKVFIGGLDYGMSDQELKSAFEKYGEIKEY
jgi:RNA recognition motif-containing protein